MKLYIGSADGHIWRGASRATLLVKAVLKMATEHKVVTTLDSLGILPAYQCKLSR